MKLGAIAFLAALAACGGKSTPVPLAPLPDDKPAEAEPAKPAPAQAPAEAAEAGEPAEPPAPAGPVDVKIPALQTTVKLIAKGAGQRAPLRYAGKAGGKQQVVLALDFSSSEAMGDRSNDMVIPTIVLTGEAETRAIDKDGKADYAITIREASALEVANARIKTADLTTMVTSLAGLVISGSVAASGAAGEVTLHVEKPDHLTAGALEMVRLTLPVLPLLPAEPVGIGAKWQTTTTTTLADKIVVTQTTDYELVAARGGTWSVKGKTTVTGADQELHGGKITKISGGGQSELAVAAGALYPTYKTSVETRFTATEQDQSLTLALRLGGAVTIK